MKSQLHYLELIYPPISNQEAEWMRKDKEVAEIISKSNLYFIGQKPETFFSFEYDESQDQVDNERKIFFIYHSGTKQSHGYIDIEILLQHSIDIDPINLEIEIGPKMIRIWNLNNNEVVDWFTTDKILFDKSRGNPYVFGLEDFADFFVYNLHYVGISKKNDSFSRLIVKPHDKRLRILSNEHPLNKGSRVTDEIVLFFFTIKSIEIKTITTADDFLNGGITNLEDYIRVIADAEKAFIKIMDAKYNEVKFDNYPKSSDGLYNSIVEKYTYSIDEDLTFITDNNTINGVRRDPLRNDNSDFIAISDEKVELIKITK